MDRCDNCNFYSELFHNDHAGLALCEECDTLFQGNTPNMSGTYKFVSGDEMCNMSDVEFLVRTDVENPGDHVYSIDRDPRCQGFGGALLHFDTPNGVITTRGWHSNSKALLKHTGLDVTALHLTRVTITHPTKGILLDESVSALGTFNRGDLLGAQFSALLGGPVKVHIESAGGSSTCFVGG